MHRYSLPNSNNKNKRFNSLFIISWGELTVHRAAECGKLLWCAKERSARKPINQVIGSVTRQTIGERYFR